MAALTIVRPPVCADPASEVPRSQWPDLLLERRNFCRSVIPKDCRMLLFFIEDGQKAEWLGFGTRERYLEEGLGLDPDQVHWAIDGLKLTAPEQAIGLDEAVFLGKRGGDRRSEVARANQSDNVTLKERGNSRAYILARLDRDGHAELARQVRAGTLSANAAAIAAGFRKTVSAFEKILKLLPKLTADELEQLRRRL